MKGTKVAIVGYGSQGRRIAEAISVQPDIELVGVGVSGPDITARMASKRRLPLYTVSHQRLHEFRTAGLDVEGSLQDIISTLDVVVDATPAGVGKENKLGMYSPCGVKAVFQAGEEFDIADIPVFVSSWSYNDAKKADFVRVPSPEAVSLLRIVRPLESEFGIQEITCTFIMPGSEPMRGYNGPVDTIVPTHHQLLNEEIRSVLLKTRVVSSSFAVPSILLGVGSIVFRLNKKASRDGIVHLLGHAPRTILVREDEGLNSTDSIFEYIRRVVRPSGDIYELCVWYERIEASNGVAKLDLAFDPHCVQTPEVIDAIRALAGITEMDESFNTTDGALGIRTGVHP